VSGGDSEMVEVPISPVTKQDNDEDKYAKKEKKPKKKGEAEKKIDENLIWLRLELSKYFGIMALMIMTIGRLGFAKFGGVRPYAAPLIFPFVSLMIHSRIVRLTLIILSQLYVCSQIYPSFGVSFEQDKPSYDIHI
jgi:hypothetical protein